jgi:hypothetical protein
VFLLDGRAPAARAHHRRQRQSGPDQRGLQNWNTGRADESEAGITATRRIMQKVPSDPALKAVTAFSATILPGNRAPALTVLTAGQESRSLPVKVSGFDAGPLAVVPAVGPTSTVEVHNRAGCPFCASRPREAAQGRRRVVRFNGFPCWTSKVVIQRRRLMPVFRPGTFLINADGIPRRRANR